jgi:hypothetical protein
MWGSKKVETPKYCKDCKHHKIQDFRTSGGTLLPGFCFTLEDYPTCHAHRWRDKVSLVTGEEDSGAVEIMGCESARMFPSWNGRCGIEGSLYEPIENTTND